MNDERRSAARRLRILVVADMYGRPEGESGSFLHHQALELRAQNIDVHVVVPRPRLVRVNSGRLDLKAMQGTDLVSGTAGGVPFQEIAHWNAPVHQMPRVSQRLLQRAVWRFARRFVGSSSFHLLHAHRVFPVGAACARVARSIGVPVVMTAHGSDIHTHPYRSDGIRRQTARALLESDATICVSSELARLARTLAPEARIVILPNGVDLDRFSPPSDRSGIRAALGLPAAGLGICVLGRLHPIKRAMDVAVAFSRLAADHPGLWIAFVGDGPVRGDLEEWRNGSGFADRIFLPGNVARDDVPAWLSATDLLVLASENEGLPNAVLEGMSAGLPVVATRVGGIPEAVEEGVTGLLVEPGRVDEIVRAIATLLKAGDLREAMGQAGRRRVEQHFSSRSVAARLADLYRDVLSARDSGTDSAPPRTSGSRA